ncbi:MAG: DUF4395 domain-containing protein [Bacteroidota bacterium]
METIGKSTIGSFTRSCIHAQGFSAFSDEEIVRLNLALRFTPAVCSVLMIVGLAWQLPVLLFVLAAIGWIGAAFARGNPLDWLYNVLVQPLIGGAVLPPNPPGRRFSCAIGGTLAAGAALAFLGGLNALAYILGGFVVAASLTVATTHWCLGSWIYGLMFGKRKGSAV